MLATVASLLLVLDHGSCNHLFEVVVPAVFTWFDMDDLIGDILLLEPSRHKLFHLGFLERLFDVGDT